MSESEMQEKEPEEAKAGEPARVETCGLGVFFKEARERQGLDLKRVADVTRLRRFIIEALENEEWDSLPQPVFVRGFIRTYARALSLDEKKALELYEGSGAAGTVEPKYPAASSKSGMWRIALVVFSVALIGVAIFLYLMKPSWDFTKPVPGEEQKSEIRTEKRLPPEKAAERAEDKEVEPEVDAGESTEPQAPEKDVIEQGSLPPDDHPLAATTEETATDHPAAVADEVTRTAPPAIASIATTEEYVLQAEITETTWVRIYVDDEDPREFIFQPGTNPQWKARKGFNLVVGNAAGITFDFNGKRVENLGNIGQVIRLFLPTDFRSEKYED